MKHFKNTKLDKYTTLKIGGEVENFFVFENEAELKEFLSRDAKFCVSTKKMKILGGGSNILVNDGKLDFDVIKLDGEFKNIYF